MMRFINTFFYIGLMRPAPGTWGSAAAIAAGLLIYRLGGAPLLASATLAVTLLGFWTVRKGTRGMADPDASEIVIDEVAGQWIALCFPAFGFWMRGMPLDQFPYPGWVAAFLLFRLFDITKPGIIGRADRRGDARGVMEDDLWAGLFAGIVTLILAGLYHGLLMR